MSKSITVTYKDSIVGSLINGVINGGIAWFEFRGAENIPLTLDAISTQEKSVFGQGVTLAIALGIILTIVAWKVFSSGVKKSRPDLLEKLNWRLFPDVSWLAVQNAMTLFGWAVALAVVWQRTLGTVFVTPAAAAALVALFAAAITAIVEVRTKKSLLS